MNTGVGDFTPTVFIDISKAYDKVWIDGLLYKLHHECQITGALFYMLRALLVGRTMQVVHNNMTSDMHTLTAGVPQGSVLAPLLFLIYIHSLTTSLSPPSANLYLQTILRFFHSHQAQPVSSLYKRRST
jgi:hypothetical protein